MDTQTKKYVESLVIGYLTQTLREYPNGVPLSYFERTFPKACEEADDWYKQYGFSSTLTALQALPRGSIKVIMDNTIYKSHVVRLIMASNKVDRELLDLVLNQRPSRFGRR